MSKHLALRNEMMSLNRRWQKAEKLDQQGYFEAFRYSDPERYARVEQECRDISQRASDIWDVLKAECPSMLKGLEFLYAGEYLEGE